MSNNTLPEEVRKEIEQKSIHYAENEWTPLNPDCPDWMTNARDYQAGATEYATKAIEERQIRAHFEKENDILTDSYKTLQAKADRLEKALRWIAELENIGRSENACYDIVTGVAREALQQHEKGGEDD